MPERQVLPWLGPFYRGWHSYTLAAAAVAAASGVGLLADALGLLTVPTILLLYAFSVSVVAAHVPRPPAVVAAVASALAFNYCFVPPQYTMGALDASDAASAGFMILLVSAISDSALRVRSQARALVARRAEIETLQELERALATASRPSEVVEIAVNRAVDLLGVDGVAAVVLVKEGRILRLAYARGVADNVTAVLEGGIAADAGVAGQAVTQRQPVAVDFTAYPDLAGLGLTEAVRDAGYRYFAATPFVAHGTVYGALSAMSARPVDVTPAVLSLLRSLGDHVGLAFAQAAERERLLAQERMAELGRLAAGVGHELRNPLAVISGRIDLLRGLPETTENIRRQIDHLDRAGGRMTGIVRGLASYSKPTAPEPVPLDIVELVREAAELMAYQGRMAGVGLTVDAPSALPAVLGDRGQLTQVLVNLVANAIEALTAGGHVIMRACGDETAVTIEVIDDGPGIASDRLPMIWSAFYTTKPEGTGLGLSIVKSLVESHGGSIGVASEPGRGTTFTVCLRPPATAST